MIQVRTQIFETNSSSVHALTVCTEDEFARWKNGELIWNRDTEKFEKSDSLQVKEAKKEYENDNWYDNLYYTYDEFFDANDDYIEYMETYEHHETIGKEDVVVFGYYGHD